MSDQRAVGVGPYVCMPNPVLQDGRWSVQAVEPDHIQAIREWRNAQLELLRQVKPISADEQSAYFSRHVWPEKSVEQPLNILLIYLQDTRPIGYGGLVHIAWEHRRAEVSFLLDPELAADSLERDELFARFLGLMKRLAFEDLGLNRLATETYTTRAGNIHVLESSGFEFEGRLRAQVWINGVAVDSVIHGCLATDLRTSS